MITCVSNGFGCACKQKIRAELSPPTKMRNGRGGPPRQRLISTPTVRYRDGRRAGGRSGMGRTLCADLAHGESVQPYIDGTLKKSPQLLPQEAARVVYNAIQSYCPQYANR